MEWVSTTDHEASHVYFDQHVLLFFHLLQSSTQEHKCYAQDTERRNPALMIEGRSEFYIGRHLSEMEGWATDLSKIVTAKTS
jgi:hypothetical protein